MLQCDAPKNTGWRPGARWARADQVESRHDVDRQIAALPRHQRPPMRMLGRSSEAAEHPFRAMPPDEAARPMKEMARRTEAAAPPFSRAAMPSACVPRNSASGSHGLALVTQHKIGSRIEIAAASEAAHALGVDVGMALTQVRALVPDIVVCDADPTGDARDLHSLAVLIARRWTPMVAKSDVDGLFLDLTGVSHLFGGEARMAARLLRMLARFGFSARIAIADTSGAAWALARFTADPVSICPPGEHADAILALPAKALRLPEKTLTMFRRLGIETISDVVALPRAPFARRFGAEAARRIDQALGQTGEPLTPVIPIESIYVVQRFAEPIGTAEAIAHWLARLVPKLTQALAEAGQGVRNLLFAADRIDGKPQPIRVGFARPTRDPAHILKLIVRRIEEVEPGFGIDALRLHVRRAEPLGSQRFDGTLDNRAADLGGLIDLLANRSVSTWRAMPIESDVPERSVARKAPLDPPPVERRTIRGDDVKQLDTRINDHPWQPNWPRPAYLLRRPERLDHVIAELPDQPPRRFTWRGKHHRVVHADGPERVTGEWWRSSKERDAIRDYFMVEDEVGQRFWLFRRGDGERAPTGDLSWYLHGRFG